MRFSFPSALLALLALGAFVVQGQPDGLGGRQFRITVILASVRFVFCFQHGVNKSYCWFLFFVVGSWSTSYLHLYLFLFFVIVPLSCIQYII